MMVVEKKGDFELTEPQLIFVKCVEAEVEQVRALGVFEPDVDAEGLGLLAWFHEPDQVSVDGYLYDILAYGQAEYGYGRTLYRELDYALHEAGWMMERDAGGVYRFYRSMM